jgi:hypothetical protein
MVCVGSVGSVGSLRLVGSVAVLYIAIEKDVTQLIVFEDGIESEEVEK